MFNASAPLWCCTLRFQTRNLHRPRIDLILADPQHLLYECSDLCDINPSFINHIRTKCGYIYQSGVAYLHIICVWLKMVTTLECILTNYTNCFNCLPNKTCVSTLSVRVDFEPIAKISDHLCRWAEIAHDYCAMTNYNTCAMGKYTFACDVNVSVFTRDFMHAIVLINIGLTLLYVWCVRSVNTRC